MQKKKNPVTDLLLLQQLGDEEDLPEMLRKEPRSPDSPVSGWPGPHGVVTPDSVCWSRLYIALPQAWVLVSTSGCTHGVGGHPLPPPPTPLAFSLPEDIHAVWGEVPS